MKSSLRNTSDILTLIGAIIQSALVAIAVLIISFLAVFSPTLLEQNIILGNTSGLIFILLFLLEVALIIFVWIAREKATNSDKAWSIYGIFHSIISLNPISLVGFIVSLLAIKQENVENEDEEICLNKEIRIAKLERELEELK